MSKILNNILELIYEMATRRISEDLSNNRYTTIKEYI